MQRNRLAHNEYIHNLMQAICLCQPSIFTHIITIKVYDIRKSFPKVGILLKTP